MNECPNPLDSVGIVITGASRGLGRAIAIAVCKDLNWKSLRMTLVSRSESGLDETKELCLSTNPRNPPPTIKTCCVDLADLDGLDGSSAILFENFEACDHVFFINNAGSLGHLGPCKDSPSLEDMRKTIDLNVTSALWLSVRFTKYIEENQSIKYGTLVNISSLVAIADFPTMGIYSAGKSARDKLHSLIAKEENPLKFKTLNYAPGPLETEMVSELRNCTSLDTELQKNFQNKLLEAGDSAKKLIRLLNSNGFESGSHIDYYDLPDE